MKRLPHLIVALLLASPSFSQSFLDDFESYASGQGIAAVSSAWSTPTGTNGGGDDLAVTSSNAHSGNNSLHFISNVSQGGGPAHLLLPLPQAITSGTLTLEWWMSIVPGTGLSSARIDLWEYNDDSSIASQMRFTYNYAWETGFKLQILDGIEVNFACE
ncbi:MAG: hypothetical protein ACKO7B_12880, partial [Flavobacteriales bacterium]